MADDTPATWSWLQEQAFDRTTNRAPCTLFDIRLLSSAAPSSDSESNQTYLSTSYRTCVWLCPWSWSRQDHGVPFCSSTRTSIWTRPSDHRPSFRLPWQLARYRPLVAEIWTSLA